MMTWKVGFETVLIPRAAYTPGCETCFDILEILGIQWPFCCVRWGSKWDMEAFLEGEPPCCVSVPVRRDPVGK